MAGMTNPFTVFIFESELNYLKWLALQKPEIETGGDIFGSWQEDGSAVVDLILGPGKNCERTSESFLQDKAYTEKVGDKLTKKYGNVRYIGKWNHKLSLTQPRDEEQITVWNQMSSEEDAKSLVFIANIEGHPQKVKVGCFLFSLKKKKMIRGIIKLTESNSRLRLELQEHKFLQAGAETGQDWTTFLTKQQSTFARNTSPNECKDIVDGLGKKGYKRRKSEETTQETRKGKRASPWKKH